MHNGISCQAVLKALKKDYPDKFVTVVIGVGLVTPPVGMCIYVACDLMDVKVGDVFPTLIPFLLATFVCIALMIAFPQLTTLPTALMRV